MTLKCLIRSLERAPSYTCLTIGYQEETKLFTQELPKYFSNKACLLIKEFFKSCMDEGFIFWPKHSVFNSFSICLNNLHPAIKYTFEKGKTIVQFSEYCRLINFLDVSVTLHPDHTIETDMITFLTTAQTQITLEIVSRTI